VVTLQDTENTLKFVYVIDAHGFIITSRVVDTTVRDFENNEIPHTMLPPVHKHKWNGSEWVEGESEEEKVERESQQLLESLKPSPVELADAELEIKMLTILTDLGVVQ